MKCIRSPRPTFSSAIMAAWTASKDCMPESSRAIATLSIAVRLSRRWKSWKIQPTDSRRTSTTDDGFFVPYFLSPSMIDPESPARRPPMILRSVDFPDPDGPIKATISPCFMLISTPLRTCSLFDPEPNDLVRLVTCNKSGLSSVLFFKH